MSATEADHDYEIVRQHLGSALTVLVKWTEPRTGDILEETEEATRAAYKTASHILGMLQENTRDPWTGSRIHKIIRKSARFIVFLDEKLDVKWWWVLRPNMETISAVQARITELTHESAFLVDEPVHRRWRWPWHPAAPEECHTRQAENIRCVIGEAMALALNDGTEAECEKVFAEAETYIAVAKDQRCRPKFVFYFLLAVLAVGLLEVARYWGWLGLPMQTSAVIQKLTQAAFAGAFGALISAVSRTTELKLEPAARTSGIVVEAVARALIGAAAGIVVNLGFEGGLFVKDALNPARPEVQESVRLFLCLAAGISERILPALVGQAESLVAKREKSIKPKARAPKEKAHAASESGKPKT